MDHFALADDDLSLAQDAGSLHRNFMGYTTHADCDLIGLGVSAISHIGDSFSQNPRELPPWEIAVDRGQPPVWRGLELSFDDRVRAEVIQQLMCNATVDVAAIESRYDIDFWEYFAACRARLEQLADDGLVELRSAARDRHVARTIAAAYHCHVLRQLSQHRDDPATLLACHLNGAGGIRKWGCHSVGK
jgi:oxygen-independent coproporphyrinogen-3 oxidase